jgi:hypothetical protein
MTKLSIPTARVISEVLDGEAIIIDSMTGAYFTLDADGTAMWARLTADGTSLEELAEATQLDPARVAQVAVELAAAGLVMVDGQLAEATSSAPPAVTKYMDMEELLLLDPIHDVDPAGWPVMPPDA